MSTHNQLHYYTTIFVKVTILSAVKQTLQPNLDSNEWIFSVNEHQKVCITTEHANYIVEFNCIYFRLEENINVVRTSYKERNKVIQHVFHPKIRILICECE